MKDELEKALVEKYPKIFAQYHLPVTRSAMGWGFSHDDGWFSLLDALCSFLQWRTEVRGDSQVVALQVKEKFGGLRFYVEGGSPEQLAAIDLVESLSYKTCEVCGATQGVEKTTGWIKTLCPTHMEEWNKRNAQTKGTDPVEPVVEG